MKLSNWGLEKELEYLAFNQASINKVIQREQTHSISRKIFADAPQTQLAPYQ